MDLGGQLQRIFNKSHFFYNIGSKIYNINQNLYDLLF